MISDVLHRLQTERSFVSLYVNFQDHSKFIFGQILGLDEKYFLFRMFSPEGAEDGLLLKETEDIIRVELQSHYQEKMMKLIPANQHLTEYSFHGHDLLEQVLKLASQEKALVSVELIHSGYNDIVGFVKSLDKDICVFQQIDEYGQGDGETFILRNSITRLSYNSMNEKSLMILLKNEKV